MVFLRKAYRKEGRWSTIFGGGQETNMQRIALVTGANEGIGLEVTRQIGRTGVIRLMGARDPALVN